jgi:signal transduction histidine kinase
MRLRPRKTLLYVVAPALLVAVTWLDYATGYELGLFVLYFAPVAMAAWYGGRAAGIAFAIAAGAGWFLSDWLSHHPYSNALFIYWETFMRTVAFLTTALTLSKIRDDLRRREELLDVISHDLRAPLGALVGHAHLLARRSRGDAFVAARVEAILRSAVRMNTMIEDLVDGARKTSHQLEPELQPVDLGVYLSELVERCAPVLDVPRLRLEIAAGNLVARADPGRLDRIVLNLLLNALKYSPPESPVELGAREENGWITIRVADHGQGIPPDDLPHVFERFYRGKRTAARGGLGIGLYSVRMLVEAHHGSVRAEPGATGGTTFLVSLPAERSAGSASLRGQASG